MNTMGILANHPQKSHQGTSEWEKTNQQTEYYWLIKFNSEGRILKFKYDLSLPHI